MINKIFEQEKRDGLETAIASSASIAYCNVATKRDNLVLNLDKDLIEKAAASANANQSDLYYLSTVLVSTGWNKNDDVFLPEHTWAARNTPEDKQFNLMHNENDIIGHITGSYVVDHQGQRIDDNLDMAPGEFDIVTEAVLYKKWQDPSNQERMDKILAEIEQDEWYVSMECLFSNFHYAVASPDGDNHLVERTEASSYLSRHLRAYGGTGEFEGYKIGRVLSDLAFSGKGLVSKPANPRSIILKSNASFNFNENNFSTNFTMGDNQMDEELKRQVEELKAELAAAKVESDSAKKEAEAKKEKEVASLIQEKEDAIAELNEKLEKALAAVNDTKVELNAKAEELTKANEELEKVAAEQKTQARKAKLIKAGLSEEDAEETVALYEPLSDEAFDKAAAKWQGFKDKKDKEDKEKKDKDSEASKDEKKDEKKDSEASEATDETFSDVEDTAEATINTPDTDDAAELRHSVASWIGNIYEINESDKKKGE